MERGLSRAASRGHIHPISSLIREANRIFFDMGFSFVDGPHVESEWYNFDALNVPKDHPARDVQDTFFMKDDPGMVLRTHMSNMQVRYIEEQIKKGVKPPYRIVYPGRVFRNEATDVTHEAEFYQLECLAVGENITMAHMRYTIESLMKGMFKNVEIRFRPSYFPFTEPSVEVDMRVSGEDAPDKLRDKWIELLGAGMVHPNVLNNAGIDPFKYQGFAFGMGLDRPAMLRWGIDDIRLMHSADLRFINQF